MDKKIEKEEPEKEDDPLHEKWKAKMEDTLRELRSTLKGKLVQLGIDPEGDLTVYLYSKRPTDLTTVEPRGYNEPQYNEVLGITNDFLYPSNSKIYEKEPRYSEISL